MEPNSYETVTDAKLRWRPRSTRVVTAVAGGLMIIGAATLGLIGVMVFRANTAPGTDTPAMADTAGTGKTIVASRRSAPDVAPVSGLRPTIDANSQKAAEKALAASLANMNVQPAAPKIALSAAPDASGEPRSVPGAVQVAALPPDAKPVAPSLTAVIPSVPAASVAPPLSLTSAEIRAYVARASSIIQDGDIFGARLLLDRAMRAGDAGAAFALAETYDPGVLSGLNVRGVQGDVPKARELYAKALEGGMNEAKARIARLR